MRKGARYRAPSTCSSRVGGSAGLRTPTDCPRPQRRVILPMAIVDGMVTYTVDHAGICV